MKTYYILTFLRILCSFTFVFTSLILHAQITPIILTPPINGACNGQIEIQAEGNAGPFRLTIEPNPNSEEFDNVSGTVTFSGLCPDTYTIFVENDYGCVKELEVNLENCPELNLVDPESIQFPTCGATNGQITFPQIQFGQSNISGGTAPYTAKWEDGPTQLNRSNLAPGVYTIVITDAAGCKLTQAFDLSSEQDYIQIEQIPGKYRASCIGSNHGSIGVRAYGNPTSHFLYQWDAPSNPMGHN